MIVWSLWKPAEGSRRLKQLLKTAAALRAAICVALPAAVNFVVICLAPLSYQSLSTLSPDTCLRPSTPLGLCDCFSSPFFLATHGEGSSDFLLYR